MQHQKLHDCWHLALGTVILSLDMSSWHTADGRLALSLAHFDPGRSWIVEGKPTGILLLTLSRMRWVSRVARIGSIEVYTGQSEEVKNHLEELQSFWEINIKICFQINTKGGRRLD